MLLEILLAIFLGVNAGVITGITPGIHVNLVSALLVSTSPLLLTFTSVAPLTVFIVAMATTHTFLDTLPSIFLGAPESATALGVLPGHRYLLNGFGLMAVKLTLIGSLGSLILSALIFIILIPFVAFIYPFLESYLGYFLLVIALFMILRDKKVWWAVTIFCISGVLGYFVLNIPNIANPLFPLLSGLFGIATLLISLNESQHIPEQKDLPYTDIKVKQTLQAFGSGTFSGFLTSVLPGVGAATAAVISMQITRKLGDHGFMVLIGGISTSNFVLSLVTLQVLDKARNGALVAVKELSEISPELIALLLSTALIVGGIATILALFIGKKFIILLKKVSYQKLVLGVILLIIVLTPLLSGLYGVLILITSTAVGLLPAISKTSRTMAMGCLLVPVMIYFLI